MISTRLGPNRLACKPIGQNQRSVCLACPLLQRLADFVHPTAPCPVEVMGQPFNFHRHDLCFVEPLTHGSRPVPPITEFPHDQDRRHHPPQARPSRQPVGLPIQGPGRRWRLHLGRVHEIRQRHHSPRCRGWQAIGLCTRRRADRVQGNWCSLMRHFFT